MYNRIEFNGISLLHSQEIHFREPNSPKWNDVNARISTKYEFICEYVLSIGKFILGLLSLSHDALLFGILIFNFRFHLFCF